MWILNILDFKSQIWIGTLKKLIKKPKSKIKNAKMVEWNNVTKQNWSSKCKIEQITKKSKRN